MDKSILPNGKKIKGHFMPLAAAKAPISAPAGYPALVDVVFGRMPAFFASGGSSFRQRLARRTKGYTNSVEMPVYAVALAGRLMDAKFIIPAR